MWHRSVLQGEVGLANSRCLGNRAKKQSGVIATPIVTEYEMESNDCVLILATDGVWEFITSQQAMDIVSKFPNDATAACNELMLQASNRCTAAQQAPIVAARCTATLNCLVSSCYPTLPHPTLQLL